MQQRSIRCTLAPVKKMLFRSIIVLSIDFPGKSMRRTNKVCGNRKSQKGRELAWYKEQIIQIKKFIFIYGSVLRCQRENFSNKVDILGIIDVKIILTSSGTSLLCQRVGEKIWLIFLVPTSLAFALMYRFVPSSVPFVTLNCLELKERALKRKPSWLGLKRSEVQIFIYVFA